ncbi:MAG: hypothetical protein LHW57_06280 [Candidatus Cloacimonetes bacterium]|nr:hypothetical protein [Candidatus Cloacimonadota bacterium]MDD3143842.1 hypothetical protein [Candidatus Cloacimonadota bacterium]
MAVKLQLLPLPAFTTVQPVGAVDAKSCVQSKVWPDKPEHTPSKSTRDKTNKVIFLIRLSLIFLKFQFYFCLKNLVPRSRLWGWNPGLSLLSWLAPWINPDIRSAKDVSREKCLIFKLIST